MLALYRRDRLFTGQFALAVDAKRVSRICFGVRRAFAAVEHVIGGVVDQRDAKRRRFFSQNARGLRVDGERRCFLALSLVDRRISRGVDDQIGTNAPDLLTNLLGLSQIKLIATWNDQLAHCTQALLQFT